MFMYKDVKKAEEGKEEKVEGGKVERERKKGKRIRGRWKKREKREREKILKKGNGEEKVGIESI